MERHPKFMDWDPQNYIAAMLPQTNLCNTSQMPPHIFGETLQIEYKINIEIGKGKRSHEV